MRALRRVTDADLRHSNTIYQLAIQTHMAHQAGEIDEEMRTALMNVFQRVHTGICVRTGIVDRQRQARYNKRAGGLSNSTLFDICVGIAVVGMFAWLVIS